MKDLKTMREIMNGIPYEEVTRTRIADEFREEAIEHIKKLQRRITQIVETADLNPEWIYQNEAAIVWIEKFFNISEEETK